MNLEISTPLIEFVQRLSPTPRGARLARRLAANWLATWGYPHTGDPNDTVQHLVAELAANAVTHGRVPGRDFELRLLLLRSQDTVRIEVSDARGDRTLRFLDGALEDECGRGLVLVQVLASRWGLVERDVGKTVWAEVALGGGRGARAATAGAGGRCPRTGPPPERRSPS